MVTVHVFAVPLAQQSHTETMCHSERRHDGHHCLGYYMCVDHSLNCRDLLSQQGCRVVTSASMDALSCSIITQQDF